MPLIEIEKRMHATVVGNWLNQGGYFAVQCRKNTRPTFLYDKKHVTPTMLMQLAAEIEKHAKNDRMSGQQLANHLKEVRRDEDEV